MQRKLTLNPPNWSPSHRFDSFRSLSLQKAPLDIFLLRSHSLPLPYLTVPSMSFLTHISPSAYLSLISNAPRKTTTDVNFLDISPARLKDALKTISKGVTIATLYLQQLSGAHLYPGSMSMPNVTSRPTFPLCPSAANYDHTFPQLDTSFSMALSHSGSSPDVQYAWVLDFTEGGKKRGIVVNQSRMKAIELVVNPIGVGNDFNTITDAVSHASWVDLLVNLLIYWSCTGPDATLMLVEPKCFSPLSTIYGSICMF